MTHERRMAKIIAQRKAADALCPPPPHRAAPYCPSCANPCGTTEDTRSTSDDLIVCGACGFFWHSPEDRAQAEAADAAYARYIEAEEQRARDEARLGPALTAVNRRLLEAQAARASSASTCEQLTLLGEHANTRNCS